MKNAAVPGIFKTFSGNGKEEHAARLLNGDPRRKRVTDVKSFKDDGFFSQKSTDLKTPHSA